MAIEVLYFNHNCNCYLLSNKKEAVLIDPGNNKDNCLINALKERHLTLKAILLTHAHFDHIEALLELKNIPIYLHELEKDTLNDDYKNCSQMTPSPFKVENNNVKTIKDKDTLNLVGYRLFVMHTPFHTAGSVCYYLEKEKILFSGDTLFAHAIGRVDLPTSQSENVSSSLKKVFSLPSDVVVYPGHGIKTSIEREYHFFKNEFLS